MPPLSTNAQQKRLRDMQSLVSDADTIRFHYILLVGFWLLVRQMTRKFTPIQRTALAAITILAGGSVIGILVYYQQVWLAIVLVFVLGIVVGTIAKM